MRAMMPRLVVAVVALLAVTVGLFQLHRAGSDLRITHVMVGDTPVTIFRPASDMPAPVIVVAHGFAGSQQLMQPFAQTLAHHGYIAVTFDFIGHGRNPVPMRGAVGNGEAITSQLEQQLDTIIDTARTLNGADGRLALLGHSMASDIVIRAAVAHPDIQATVAVSAFSPAVTAASPRNLLVIVGALEPQMLQDEGLRMLHLAAGSDAVAGTTYGDPATGTGRKLAIAKGVEHIGVLYSHDSLTQSLLWLDGTFDRHGTGAVDHRGIWLALTFAGMLALAWPLSLLLPVASAPAGAGLSWNKLIVAALVPAILTPLLLWKAPTDFLPILLGDYLLLHFLIYGVLTAAITRALSGRMMSEPTSWPAAIVAGLAIALYGLLTFGATLDAYVFSFMPIPPRLPLLLALCCGTLPYFLADEWLTRNAPARRGGYPLTKFCFLLSLAAAIALNPAKLFFLAIIVPAILLLQLIFGLISRWSFQATRHPLPGALANALIFAWAFGVTFPMIAR